MRGDLSEAALQYWTGKAEAVCSGIVNAGKYESFIRLFSRFVGVMQGKKRIDGLFRCATLEQQQDYFARKWNTVRWRLLFKLLASKRVLAKRGLTSDYFKFDDGSASFSESFLRRARRGLCEIPVESNYFLTQYLLARYRSEEAVPAYLLRDNLPVVRGRLDRIEIVTSSAQEFLGQQPDDALTASASPISAS